MAEAKSFADKAVELLLRSLRTVFNERVVLAVEKLIVETRENFIGEEAPVESHVILTSDRKINTKSTLPWMLSNEEKAKMDFTSIDFASQNALGVGSAESEDVDIEGMINASKQALNFLQKQARVQGTNLNSFANFSRFRNEYSLLMFFCLSISMWVTTHCPVIASVACEAIYQRLPRRKLHSSQ